MNERKKRTYEVNEAKGNSLIIEQGRGRGCGGQKKVLLPGGQERCVCGVCLEKMKKKMPCKRAQQFFPLCSGIVEQELTLHMPSGPLLTQNRSKVKKNAKETCSSSEKEDLDKGYYRSPNIGDHICKFCRNDEKDFSIRIQLQLIILQL